MVKKGELKWRCLKSTLMVRPVFHWTERRIRAHIFVCVLALQVERWMRRKLQAMNLYHGLTKDIKLCHWVEISSAAGIRGLTKGDYFPCHRQTAFFD